eukprot:CAMPEP_0198140178 /NCGR_PEP_ID=MMETSP1443-20131203/3390_1 /TAXON_ID=186043 /ORGANISM="Entomoneis sp., Strain CCMP2396" /LENGTH=208 /DNA_ID=CAMNT_0043802525 /DNA_START=241 /DNA_END=867 /DNA_ORIENTATION=+
MTKVATWNQNLAVSLGDPTHCAMPGSDVVLRVKPRSVSGKGWFVLSQWESLFPQQLKEVDITVDVELQEMILNPISIESRELMEKAQTRIEGGDLILTKSANGAYTAFLGYYLGQMKRIRMRNREELVYIANSFATLCGLTEPPAITKMLVGKMGLKGVAGVNIGEGDDNMRRVGGGGGAGNRRNNNNNNSQNHGHSDGGRRAPIRRR